MYQVVELGNTMGGFDKSELKAALLASVEQEVDAALMAARQAQETASHEDNQPENQYDTLSLEAAYLAHGQSERILTLQQEQMLLAKWPVHRFDAKDAIAVGALVQLESSETQEYKTIWITPKGGRVFSFEGVVVQVISPETPLAQQLVGLSVGDEISLSTMQHIAVWEIVNIY